ncbi:MAG TPA: TlpA disulfide reductase family protein [Parasegetibacter sp.]
MKKIVKNCLALAFAAVVAGNNGYAQTDEITLTVGDPAPEIKAKWVKGTPVQNFTGDQLYVVEFWATWCGPCIAAMPHLSELAKKYEGKVEFIGVDIWEKGLGDKPYESVYPVIKEFVDGMGNKMAYNVAMDNNDLHMSEKWMKAAGQQGIPSTFLIKDGVIIWVGHPQRLDPVLEQVFAGTYNMEEYAKTFKEKTKESLARSMPLINLNKQVEQAVAAKDFKKAIALIDEGTSTIDPMFKISLAMLKFNTLLAFDVPEALKYARDARKEFPSISSVVAMGITEKDGLPVDAYKLANEFLLEMLSGRNAENPMIHQLVAQSYFKLNDKKNAVTSQEKAVQLAETALKEGTMEGRVNAGTVREYKETLEKYKTMK